MGAKKKEKKEKKRKKINGRRQKEEKCVTLYTRQAFREKGWKPSLLPSKIEEERGIRGSRSERALLPKSVYCRTSLPPSVEKGSATFQRKIRCPFAVKVSLRRVLDGPRFPLEVNGTINQAELLLDQATKN